MIRILHPRIGAFLLSRVGKLVLALVLVALAFFALYPVLFFFGLVPWIWRGEPIVNITSLVAGPLVAIVPLKFLGPLCLTLQYEATLLFNVWRANRLYIQAAPGVDASSDYSSHFLLKDSSGRRTLLLLPLEIAKMIAGDTWATSETHFAALRLIPRELLARHDQFRAKKQFILEFLEGQKRDPMLLECDETMLQKMELDHAYLLSWLATLDRIEPGHDLDQRIEMAERTVVTLPEGRARERMFEDISFLRQRRFQLSRRVGVVENVERELDAMENRLQFLHDGLSLRSNLEELREPMYVPSSLLQELRLDA